MGQYTGLELYDVVADPQCVTNLSGQPAHQSVQTALHDQLLRELRAQQDPRMFGQGEMFDNYPYAGQGQRGFYERYMSGEKLNAGWVNPSDFEKDPLKE